MAFAASLGGDCVQEEGAFVFRAGEGLELASLRPEGDVLQDEVGVVSVGALGQVLFDPRPCPHYLCSLPGPGGLFVGERGLAVQVDASLAYLAHAYGEQMNDAGQVVFSLNGTISLAEPVPWSTPALGSPGVWTLLGLLVGGGLLGLRSRAPLRRR